MPSSNTSRTARCTGIENGIQPPARRVRSRGTAGWQRIVGANSTNDRGSDHRNGAQRFDNALGVLLGFSIAILSEWSNRPGKWELVGAIPLFLYGSSVALQVLALYRALQIPRETQAQHRRTINLAVIGLVVMFLGFLSTIAIDVLGEPPVNTPTANSRQ